METFLDRLKTVIGGMSQKEFARKVGVNVSTVATWNNTLPSGNTLTKIASEFEGVDLNWLITGVGTPYVDTSDRISRTADKEVPWGRTEQTEVGGKPFTVTTYGGDQDRKEPTPPAPVLGQAVEMLATVLSSGDQVFVQALMSNLIAFSSAVRESKRQAARIAALEERLAVLENKLKDKPEEQCTRSAAM